MAGIRALLRKYATKSELHSAMAAEHPVPDASPTHSGLMSADDKKKLERIEANATGDMTGEEILTLLADLKVGALPLDVLKLHGKTASEFAPRDHTHDERYMPRDQVISEMIKIIDQITNVALKTDGNIEILNKALQSLIDSISRSLTPERIGALVAQLDQSSINAIKLAGKTLEDLDNRYADANAPYLTSVDPFLKGGIRSQAVNGGMIKEGQFTIDVARGNLWRVSNGGGFTFMAPKTKDDFEAKCVILHHPQFAGTVEFFGFSPGIDQMKILGEHHKGKAHLVSIVKVGPFYHLTLHPLT